MINTQRRVQIFCLVIRHIPGTQRYNILRKIPGQILMTFTHGNPVEESER